VGDSAEFGRRGGEDRTVATQPRHAALSQFASVNPSPSSPMPFSDRHPSPEPFPRSPTASAFSAQPILRRDRSLLLPRVGAKQAPYFLRRRYLEALALCLDRIRGAQALVWVEVCKGRSLGRLGNGRSRG